MNSHFNHKCSFLENIR